MSSSFGGEAARTNTGRGKSSVSKLCSSCALIDTSYCCRVPKLQNSSAAILPAMPAPAKERCNSCTRLDAGRFKQQPGRCKFSPFKAITKRKTTSRTDRTFLLSPAVQQPREAGREERHVACLFRCAGPCPLVACRSVFAAAPKFRAETFFCRCTEGGKRRVGVSEEGGGVRAQGETQRAGAWMGEWPRLF